MAMEDVMIYKNGMTPLQVMARQDATKAFISQNDGGHYLSSVCYHASLSTDTRRGAKIRVHPGCRPCPDGCPCKCACHIETEKPGA